MKKFKSLFTAVVIVVTVLCTSAISAFAVEPWPERTDFKEPFTYVNGIKSSDIYLEHEYTDSVNYRYLGGGTVTGWDFPTLDNGIDYEIVKKGDDNITIKLLKGKKTVPYINVSVAFENWPLRSNVQDITAFVNGKRPGHVVVKYAPDSEAHRLEYTGEGTVMGWIFPSMTEGKNYKVVETKDNYIDIVLINGQDEIPDVNVLVDFTALGEAIDAGDTVHVNGEKSGSIICEYNKFDNSYTYKYTGDGRVAEWDFADLVENMNYQILETGANSITVILMNGQETIDYVNAVVVAGEAAPGALQNTAIESGKTDIDASPDNSAPADHDLILFVSVAAAAIVLIGAVAALVVKKKKK